MSRVLPQDKTRRPLVPKLRFPQFRNAPGWGKDYLYEIAEPVAQRAEESVADVVLTLSAEHGLINQGEYFGRKIAGDNVERYIRIIENDFVYNDRTTKQSEFGTIKRLTGIESGIVSPIYKCFRFNAGENPTFWEWYFDSLTHDSQLRSLVNEGARDGRFNISITKFLSTQAYFPSKQEQHKIADCLSSLDELITAQAQKVEALRAHKKGLMQLLFPTEGQTLPTLRFPEFRNAGEWRFEPLGGKTTKVGSGSTPLGGSDNYKSFGRPFIRSQNVGWGALILDDVAYIDEDMHSSFDSTEILQGDVLLNITGASIGRSAVADGRIYGGNVNQHVCIIRTISDDLSPYFLNQYLLSQYGQDQIDRFQAGGNRQGLNFVQVRSIQIPLPFRYAEQQKIADCLSSLDELIAAQASKVEVLKAHKKGLMQQLFPAVSEVQE